MSFSGVHVQVTPTSSSDDATRDCDLGTTSLKSSAMERDPNEVFGSEE